MSYQNPFPDVLLIPFGLIVLFILIQAYYVHKECRAMSRRMKQKNYPKAERKNRTIEKLLELDKTEMETWHKN